MEVEILPVKPGTKKRYAIVFNANQVQIYEKLPAEFLPSSLTLIVFSYLWGLPEPTQKFLVSMAHVTD